MKEEWSRKSRLLRDASEKSRLKALELVGESMDEAAKDQIANSLYFKQKRSDAEKFLAKCDRARIEVLMKPEIPPSRILDKINTLMRESVAEGERINAVLNRMSTITQVGMEQTKRELETYGIKEKQLDEEFKRLKEEAGLPVVTERKEEEIEETKFPNVPKKEPEAKPASKKEKEAEKVS